MKPKAAVSGFVPLSQRTPWALHRAPHLEGSHGKRVIERVS